MLDMPLMPLPRRRACRDICCLRHDAAAMLRRLRAAMRAADAMRYIIRFRYDIAAADADADAITPLDISLSRCRTRHAAASPFRRC